MPARRNPKRRNNKKKKKRTARDCADPSDEQESNRPDKTLSAYTM
jgi:hypothetical protein